MIRVTDAHRVTGYVVWVRFNDGTEGEVDLAGELHGPMFEPLRDEALFSQLGVDPEIHTISWPNGADIAPEYLHQKVTAVAESTAG